VQGAEHAAAEARAVAHDNARAEPVFISGATGVNADLINGVLEPTEEKGLDGRVLYRKRGDSSVCMEHFGGKWQVKSVSSKGKGNCYASVRGGCAAEACSLRPWIVSHGKGGWIEPSPRVNLGAGAAGVGPVGGGRLPAPPPPPPTHLCAASSDLSLFLCRALSMPPPRREPLPTTTRALSPCSSAAPQVSMLI
jgi:hypothetical protein